MNKLAKLFEEHSPPCAVLLSSLPQSPWQLSPPVSLISALSSYILLPEQYDPILYTVTPLLLTLFSCPPLPRLPALCSPKEFPPSALLTHTAHSKCAYLDILRCSCSLLLQPLQQQQAWQQQQQQPVWELNEPLFVECWNGLCH
jgi:hypothetical protein